MLEALQARLKVLEDEILCVTKLAAEAKETLAQDNYWRMAQDLQREARELRLQIARTAESSAPDHKSRGRFQVRFLLAPRVIIRASRVSGCTFPIFHRPS